MFCRNWVIRKIAPNMPTDMRAPARLIAVKARLRNIRIGTIGCSVRFSHTTNRAITAVPPISAPRTWGMSSRLRGP